MINLHNTGNHTSELEGNKELIVRSNINDSLIIKKENNSEATNKQTLPHSTSQPVHIKIGKPLRVVLPNHTQTSQKKLIESMSIDCILVESKEKNYIQQNQSKLQKIGAKLKHKLNCQLQQSHQIQNKDDSHFVSTSVSNFQSGVDQQKFLEFKDWVSSQILKINQKIKVQDERLDILCKQSDQMEQKEVFSGQQMQELNRILTLVEKAGNREDYKRTTRMIEQLRTNILQLHQQLSLLSQKTCKQHNFTINDVQKLIKKNEQKQLSLNNMSRLLENYRSQDDKIKMLQIAFTNLQERLSDQSQIKSSSKRLVGQMITLSYFQKIVKQKIVEQKAPGLAETATLMQNKNEEITIFSNIYYIDTEGYLLDSKGFYLLNKNQEQIRLTSREIDLLKTNKII